MRRGDIPLHHQPTTIKELIMSRPSWWPRQVNSPVFGGLKCLPDFTFIKASKNLFLNVTEYQIIKPFIGHPIAQICLDYIHSQEGSFNSGSCDRQKQSQLDEAIDQWKSNVSFTFNHLYSQTSKIMTILELFNSSHMKDECLKLVSYIRAIQVREIFFIYFSQSCNLFNIKLRKGVSWIKT